MSNPRKCLEGFETCVGPDAPPTRKFRCQTCSVEFDGSGGMDVTIHEKVRAYMAQPAFELEVQRAIDVTRAALVRGEIGLGERVTAALGVLLLSKNTRELLASNDPAAVRQALGAIGIKL